ncbi:phosphatase PAP2/dual specificity phosphatase family protein [Montanilutibacter psychrotolerans]|uniref:Phosphatase PAP2 family protein n=1 Tax=Montanilutibacter psychrotolerans TaxID=1327343 RepID=A0A3M8SSQ4_9GAMM|nr:phosphatase PAP2/dual specificity phosphatase family protein [Lysobacter psychrotolerans]RNF82254.1 phosphatase PAP2 family protein [Lysobacter psychrotolerans]
MSDAAAVPSVNTPPPTAVPSARPWKRAIAWLVLLGPLFFLSYGWANSLAAARVSVPSVVFGWESAIPFWAWTIVPYWSIDAFYAVSLFICRDRRELDRQALRLLTAQFVAVTCFVLWPLRFSFTRPDSDGVFGWLFDVLLGFDKPFNQAPSLHIVLLVILWLRFGAHLHGVWRWWLHGWAVLIAVSVLTTFQHHFFDVPTGLLAGFLCAWLWPMRVDPPWRGAVWTRERARWRLAALYLAGAMSLALPAVVFSGAALWLLWPAVSLLLVATNYALLGASGFQKQADGRLTVAAQWLYAPYLLAAWINSRWWTRRSPRPVPVCDDVWLGRVPTATERDGFDVVVDLAAELPLADARADDAVRPTLDLIAPAPTLLRAVAADIEIARSRGRVLVCCALGYSRSASAVAAWLLHSGRAASVELAIARVQAARPAVVLGEPHRQALQLAFDGGTPMHPAAMPASSR